MARSFTFYENIDLANPTSGKKEYAGSFELKDGILLFKSGSVPAKNISSVSNFPIKYVNRIPLLFLIISILIAVIMLGIANQKPSREMGAPQAAAIPFLVFGAISAYGIWERNRPRRYGITLVLNSGHRHYFIHKQKAFIDKTYGEFVDALRKGTNYKATFIETHIHGTNVINVESGAQVGNISDNNSVQNTPTTMSNNNNGGNTASNSITIGSGSSAGNISGNNSINGGNGSNSIAVGNGSDVGHVTANNRVTAGHTSGSGFCGHCGSPYAAGAAFCGSCGNSLA